MSPSAHASGDVTEVLASFRAELGELDAERARRVRAQFDAAKGEPPPLGARSFPAHDVVLVSAPARHGARTAAVAALAFAVVVGALAAVTLIGRGTGDREVAASVPARSLAELAGLARRRSDEQLPAGKALLSVRREGRQVDGGVLVDHTTVRQDASGAGTVAIDAELVLDGGGSSPVGSGEQVVGHGPQLGSLTYDELRALPTAGEALLARLRGGASTEGGSPLGAEMADAAVAEQLARLLQFRVLPPGARGAAFEALALLGAREAGTASDRSGRVGQLIEGGSGADRWIVIVDRDGTSVLAFGRGPGTTGSTPLAGSSRWIEFEPQAIADAG